jgi:fermentation-respiration switch protein FrsA (DUF1100 family)
MKDLSKIDFSVLDRPEVLMYLFHPRPEAPGRTSEPTSGDAGFPARTDVMIPVEKNVVIGGRYHMATASACNILFFHGNGEIVADYDELSGIYHQIGANFLAVDYRGYGRSSGTPTVTAMMRDCHIILDYTIQWLDRHQCTGPLVVMGRSLGSASALELAANYPDRVAGLIIESGFAYAAPLLALLGIDSEAIGFREEAGFSNVDKIKTYDGPTLVIHAEYDHIIPFSEGQTLFDASSAGHKQLLQIPGANHNDIHFRGLQAYMQAIKDLIDGLK